MPKRERETETEMPIPRATPTPVTSPAPTTTRMESPDAGERNNLINTSGSDNADPVVLILMRKLLKVGDEVDYRQMEIALEALQACFRYDEESKNIFHQFQGVEFLVRTLASGVSELVKVACLGALDAVLANSRANQLVFLECDGIKKVVRIIRDDEVGDELKRKCGDFMIRLIGHVNGRFWMPPLTPENIDLVVAKPLFDHRACPGRKLKIFHNLPLSMEEMDEEGRPSFDSLELERDDSHRDEFMRSLFRMTKDMKAS